MAIISAYPVGTPAAGDYLVGSDITTTGTQLNPTKNFVISQVVATGLGYTTYTALLSQTGAVNPPTAVELKNDTGATMTYTRSGPGVYVVTASAPIFTANKTIVFINNGSLQFIENVEWTRSAPTAITIDTAGDTRLSSASFEIRIYD